MTAYAGLSHRLFILALPRRGEKSGLEDADLKVGATKRQAATTGRTPKLSRGQTLESDILNLGSRSFNPRAGV